MSKYIVSDEFGAHFIADHLTFHMIECFTDDDLRIIDLNNMEYLSDASPDFSLDLQYSLTWSPIEFFQDYEMD